MFLATTIWQWGIKRLGLAATLALGLILLTAQPAEAAGEKYTWKDAGKTAITATGGNFGGATVEFTKGADQNGNLTYSGSASYTCGGESFNSTLTLSMTASAQAANQGSATLSGTNARCGADALANFSPPIVQVANVNPVTGQPAPATTKDTECNQGGFSWIFCPVIDNVSTAISNLTRDVLVPLLKVSPVSAQTTPELYKAWGTMRDLANALFVVIFFAIIAGTLLGRDVGWFSAYNVREIWPRLIIAVIAVQFSFLIAGFLVDIGNVTGAGVETLLSDAIPDQAGKMTVQNVAGNLVAGAVGVFATTGAALVVLTSWTAAIPLLISLLLSLLVVFLTLGARFLLIAILVVLAPLACAAMVLPNTRDYANAWLKLFFRLVMMYPIVVAVIMIAGILNKILPFSGDVTASGAASVAVAIVKPLIVIAAFLIIPVSFKFAGAALNRLQDFFSRGAIRGKTALRGSEMWARGAEDRRTRQATMMNRVLNSKPITGLQRKGTLGRGAAGLMSGAAALSLLNAPATNAKLQERNSAILATTKKRLEGLNEAWNPKNVENAIMAYEAADSEKRSEARANAQAAAPDLLQYASTSIGRRAMKQMLADRDFLTAELAHSNLPANQKGSWLNPSASMPHDYAADLAVLQSKRSIIPATVMRLAEDNDAYQVKDGVGRVIRTEARQVGDVDTTGVARRYRLADAKTMQDKNRFVDYDLMKKAADPNASEHDRRVAKQTFEAVFGLGVQETTVNKVFDITSKWTESNPEARLQILQSLQAHADQYPQNSKVFDTATKYLHQDERVVSQLIRQTGATEADIKHMDLSAQAMVVRNWIKGNAFNRERKYGEEASAYATELIRATAVEQEVGKLRKQKISSEVRAEAARMAAGESYSLRRPPSGASAPGGQPQPGGPTSLS